MTNEELGDALEETNRSLSLLTSIVHNMIASLNREAFQYPDNNPKSQALRGLSRVYEGLIGVSDGLASDADADD